MSLLYMLTLGMATTLVMLGVELLIAAFERRRPELSAAMTGGLLGLGGTLGVYSLLALL